MQLDVCDLPSRSSGKSSKEEGRAVQMGTEKRRMLYRKVRWTFSVCQIELVANAFGAIGSV